MAHLTNKIDPYDEELNTPNVFKINGTLYYSFFEISDQPERPKNAEDDLTPRTNVIRLTKSAIISLDIFENFFEPFCSGQITINNPFDFIEDNHYTQGNGQDYLHVTLYEWAQGREDAERSDNTLRKAGSKLQNKKLEYTFVLTNEGNSISKSDRSNNFKTYSLLDKNYAKLNETVPYGKRYPTDEMKETGDLSVGNIIKQVLIDALGPNNEEGNSTINEKLWDPGNHNIGENNGEFAPLQEYIIPPLQWKYSDLLKYLLRINYSLGGEGEKLPVQSVLQFDRVTKQYSLLPINWYFQNNTDLVIEGFGVGDLTGNPDNVPPDESSTGTNKNNPRSGTKKNPIPVNIYEGMLKNTNLITPMLTYGNEFFVNYSVGFRDPITGIEGQTQVSIADILDGWKRAFVDPFKLVGGPAEMFLPLSKENEHNVRPMIFPFGEKQCINLAKAQMVSNLTFFNLQLTLDNEGNTNRQPGKFIDVFKLLGSTVANDTPSDAKLLGRWFVTGIHHRFIKDSYENIIQCIKTYIGPDLDIRSNPGEQNGRNRELDLDFLSNSGSRGPAGAPASAGAPAEDRESRWRGPPGSKPPNWDLMNRTADNN